MLSAISFPFRSVLLPGVIAIIFSCQDREVQTRAYPVIDTHEVTDVSAAGAFFNGLVLDPGTETVSDHGFVYYLLNPPDYRYAERVSLGPSLRPGKFRALANRNLIKDVNYYVRAYARLESGLIVYGQTVNFLSHGGMPPLIQKMEPEAGVPGDTVLLTGEGFSVIPSQNNTYFGFGSAVVVKSKADSLWCVVPADASVGENQVRVTIAGATSIFSRRFTLQAASITSFSPEFATFGDMITISGANLPKTPALFTVTLLGKRATIISSSRTSVKVTVPAAADQKQSTIELSIGSQKLQSAGLLTLLPPEIDSFLPVKGTAATVVEIKGNNFSPLPSGNKVFLGPAALQVLSATKTALQVKIPANIPPGEYPVTVSFNGYSSQSITLFEVL